jgi:hypothetical protein
LCLSPFRFSRLYLSVELRIAEAEPRRNSNDNSKCGVGSLTNDWFVFISYTGISVPEFQALLAVNSVVTAILDVARVHFQLFWDCLCHSMCLAKTRCINVSGMNGEMLGDSRVPAAFAADRHSVRISHEAVKECGQAALQRENFTSALGCEIFGPNA